MPVKAKAAGSGRVIAMQNDLPLPENDLPPLENDLPLLERAVPRYTSYPTAPHFSGAVDGTAYAHWLEALRPEGTLSLYLHVPFCSDICHYCGCNTKAVHRSEPVERYAEVLMQEIRLIARHHGGGRVVHLHWGGGTPSILGANLLARVTAELQAGFAFADGMEHNIELDPRRITPELVRGLKAIGVNRVSLGVQDFAPHVQQVIGRVQPFEEVARAVDWLREGGIEAINFDLMYGLPLQGRDDLAESAGLAVRLAPARIALFGYAHVPWFKKHQTLIREEDLPGPHERLAQARIAADIFEAAGYQAIGLDHFAFPNDTLAVAARANRLHRNFQGYTTDDADALIGLGASSIGRLPQGFVQNAPDVGGYARAIGEGRPATVKGIALSDEDRRRAGLIERLMCDLSLDLARHGGSHAFSDELAALRPLEARGLVKVDGERIAVTEEGRPFIRLAAAVFDSYLAQNRARHSVAV